MSRSYDTTLQQHEGRIARTGTYRGRLTGHVSDPRVTQFLNNGPPLAWTGQTVFERVLPKPPRGKVPLGIGLVGKRGGSR